MKAEDLSFRVRTKPIAFLNNQEVSIVCLDFDSAPPCSVSMGFSSTISAINTLGDRNSFLADLFDGARGDDEGNIQLASGEYLHACEVDKFTFPEWGPKETHVVNAAINFMEAQAQCFRMLGRRDLDDPNSLEMIPAVPDASIAYIDYMAIRDLHMERKKLDAFIAYYEAHTPREKHLSRQTIADILSDAGVRIPARKKMPST